MNFRPHRRERLEINITAMIDVVFLLLIFFMVTTTFSRETELKIVLPDAQGTPKTAEAHLEITIDPEGNYYINRHEVSNRDLDTLKRALRQAAGVDKKPPLVISADAKTPHQAVIRAMDAASQLGFVHITFATKAPPEKAL